MKEATLWKHTIKMSGNEQMMAGRKYLANHPHASKVSKHAIKIPIFPILGLWILGNIFLYLLMSKLAIANSYRWLLLVNALFLLGAFLYLQRKMKALMGEEINDSEEEEDPNFVRKETLILNETGLECGALKYNWDELESLHVFDKWLYLKTVEEVFSPISLRSVPDNKIARLKKILEEKGKLIES